MRAAIVDRQVKAMDEAGLDALLASTPENYAYLTGFVVPSHPLMRWRHAMTVVTRDGRVAVLSVDMEETTVRSRLPDSDIRVWGEFTDNAMDVLADLLRDLGLASAAIGVELDHLPAGDVARLKERLPSVRLVAAQDLFNRMRQIKTPEEIEILRRLSRIADKSISDAYGAVRTGSSEMDIAGTLVNGIYANGAEYFQLLIVATGERSEYPNVGPTERRLEPGDLCRVEIFPIIGGYHAGVCRTAIVQQPKPRYVDIWKHLTECKHMLLERIKPGARTKPIYDEFIRKLGELNLPPIDFVGHGIGLHLHEDPYISKYADHEIEAGMVLGIEPLTYGKGRGFGLQNKDMVLVTETGCELLSDHTNTDTLIPIP